MHYCRHKVLVWKITECFYCAWVNFLQRWHTLEIFKLIFVYRSLLRLFHILYADLLKFLLDAKDRFQTLILIRLLARAHLALLPLFLQLSESHVGDCFPVLGDKMRKLIIVAFFFIVFFLWHLRVLASGFIINFFLLKKISVFLIWY